MKRFLISFFFLSTVLSTINSQQVTFKVKTPGSLSSMIAESKKYSITNMKIVGEINSDDMRFIREMAGRNYGEDYNYSSIYLGNTYIFGSKSQGSLEVLDLSEASFVVGGNGYLYCKKNNWFIRLQLERDIVNDAQFARCEKLKKIILPVNISEIRDGAFYECNNLEEVVLPSYVTKLGRSIFFRTTIREISLGKYAEGMVGLRYVFDGAKDLKKIYLNEENIHYKEVDGVLYSADGDSLLLCPAGREGVCCVAEGTKVISEASFAGCNRLSIIQFPETVEKLDRDIFYADVYFSYDYQQQCCPKSIFCYAETPPQCENDAFSHFIQNTAQTTLYVPRDCKTVYEYAKGWGDFMVIEEFSASPCPKPTISYTNGKLEFHCDVEGAEFVSDITDADIKTHHAASIPLSATYHISVYATAPGYDRSESTTATLCWIAFEPSMEGEIDNEDNVKEIAAIPVLIQADGNIINVQGAVDGTEISVYSLDGVKQGSVVAKNGITTISTNLQYGSTAIVRIGNKSVKVMIK